MGIFSNTIKKLNSEEFENLNKKLIVLTTELENIKVKFEMLQTNQNSLRGLVNRKVGDIKEESEDIKGGLPFPFRGA